ncbi:hypothetical protein CMO88_05050 [Candidatus Woesearchaeota archaeon]|nr:hypothetical protein [Candidatus Woesearchaeota archaeon]
MKRKVIQIAGSTQLVSLPRQWAKKNNLIKGQEIEVIENGNKVIVTTEANPEKRKITVDVSNLMPKMADRLLTRAYQQGYDELTIKFDKIESGIALQNKIRELLGFDIFEQTENEMVIKSISSKLDVDFESSLRKAFLIALDISQICVTAFKKEDKKTLENLHYRDLELNKFCYFCLRAINKGQYDEYDKYILYYIIETLEDVGDAYKELISTLLKISPKSKMVNILEKINEVLRLSYQFFYKPEKEYAFEAYEKLQKTKKLVENALTSSSIDEIKTLMVFDNILKLIYHFSTMRLDKLKELKEIK